MKNFRRLWTSTIFLIAFPLLASSIESKIIPAEIFNPGYLEGDSNYHCLTAASNGKIYFAVNSHHPDASVRIYRFDTNKDRITLVVDVSEALGLDPKKQIIHGKIHTPLIEHNGYLYFATHTSQYDGNVPMKNPSDGRAPYEGGHFMRLNLDTEELEDLAHLNLPNEGIITMEVDKVEGTLYGLTWPTGLLISYNLEEGLLQNWGSVHERGEWGHMPNEWDFVCRTLGVDDKGVIYGSSSTGRVWQFDKTQQRPVNYYKNLDLDAVPPIQSSSFEMKPEIHYFWRNWRTITWNPNTDSFWALHGGSSQLFEFSPSKGEIRSIRPMIPNGIEAGRRNPLRTQLGFMLGPNNTLFYLAHGLPVNVEERKPATTSVHLLTYQIDTDTFTDHGVVMGSDNRRIYFTESIDIGQDGHLYSLAWVETIGQKKMQEVQAARGFAVPEETKDLIYEMQLVRLPKWDSFISKN